MEKEQKQWIAFGVLSLAAAGGFGWMIYSKQGDIETSRQEVATLEGNIATARKTIEGTAALEQEVIVLREVSTVIDQILPTSEDLNRLIDDFHAYATETGVWATAFKLKSSGGGSRGGPALSFERIGYTLNLEGGLFEFLEFLNRIETHSRFLAVPSFKVTSSSRQEIDLHGEARHQIMVDVETYSYPRKSQLTPVRIEGFGRKRDLLTAEINRRRKALTVGRYSYRGDRGRRDPWIDPRVPVMGEDDGWPVPDQIAKVDELSALTAEAMQQWLAVDGSRNVLERMVEKDQLISMLGELDEELRRVEADGAITYVPAQKRMETEVYEPRLVLAEKLETGSARGMTMAELQAIQDQMIGHIEAAEYQLALQVYTPIRTELEVVASDPVRSEVADVIHELAAEAETLQDFSAIELNISGFVSIDGKSAVVVNGEAMVVGDEVLPGLEVADIQKNKIDFYFRGFVLTRLF